MRLRQVKPYLNDAIAMLVSSYLSSSTTCLSSNPSITKENKKRTKEIKVRNKSKKKKLTLTR